MLLRSCVFVFGLFLTTTAAAQLEIQVTRGIDNPTSIAIAPFAWDGLGSAPTDFAQIVDSDLARSGQFSPVSRGDMLSLPAAREEVFYRDWRAISTRYLVIGRVSQGTQLRVDFSLHDVERGVELFSGQVVSAESEARMAAHRVADAIYEKLTGIPGAFATRLIYVSVTRNPDGKDFYRLTVADADGRRPIVLLEGRDPILAPSWSPDGKEVAYVSFESSRPAIYRQVLATGEREQLTYFQGLNNSPVWSPDGKSMALVLSKDGSPDIYLLDLKTKQFQRLTRHYGIDTEPTWMPDGQSLLFTSDRGGRPQIYRYELATGKIERITFEGRYNARARIAEDGRNVALVHQRKGRFHIAVFDLVTERLTVLTETSLDESPSIAPNGSLVIYATKRGERSVLGAVAVDGGVKFSLPARSGSVQEPAWSPMLVEQ